MLPVNDNQKLANRQVSYTCFIHTRSMELLPNNNLVRGNETTFYKDPSLATTTTEARPATVGARTATARAMVRTTAGAMV